jgi:hypothetical protein
MERRLYILVSAMVAFAGLVLALHLLRMQDSIPSMVRIRGRGYSYMVSHRYYVTSLLLNALLLPVLCAVFGYVAHMGRQIDVVSWLFVVGFYVAIWWLSWEADHAYQMAVPHMSGISIGSVSNPLAMLGIAVGAGLGFWKWKQDWDPSGNL